MPEMYSGASRQDTAIASAYSGQDGLRPAGSYISSVVGVRVATPFFGTGFNACIGAPAALRAGLKRPSLAWASTHVSVRLRPRSLGSRVHGLGNISQWHRGHRMQICVGCPAS